MSNFAELMERRAQLKQALRTGRRVFAAWSSLAHPSITEVFARTGVDFVGIDIEHSTISLEQSLNIIAAAQAGGSLCLPRIASHNAEAAKRLLDSGADGLIVPMVSTLEEAEEIGSWLHFPPVGRRSFGVARAHGYGFDFDDYTKRWNDVSNLIVQIESAEGVENIEAILSVEAIDGAMVGPFDLSGSLGVPGEIHHRRVAQASKRVAQACKQAGKACGTHIVDVSPKAIEQAFAAGFTFAVLSSDVFLLRQWADEVGTMIDGARR